MTYLAVPISAESLEAAGRQIRTALSAGAEMLELRTDYLRQLSGDAVRGLIGQARELSGARVPILVTCRDPHEGGAGAHPEELRLDALRAAVEAGAEFVDCEYATFTRKGNAERLRTALSARPNCRLILSAHDFQGPFSDIRRLHRDIRKACSEAIPKLVYTAHHISDCFVAFDLLRETGGQGVPDRIVLCMGVPGLISRVVAKKLGSLVTFASLDEQAATAPGQLTIASLKGLYRYDTIDADTELFGVIADPVGHSMSPAIHNASFADKGMNRLYLPLLVQSGESGFNLFLDNVLARSWLDFRGFSVTIPHKHSALKYVHEKGGFVEPLADKIGAANTLIMPPAQNSRAGTHDLRRGPILAYNTDYAGALDAITAGMGIERKDLRDVRVAVVGAGGVSRAIVAGLTDAGAKLTIYNRTVERAEELAAEFGGKFAGLDQLAAMNAKLLINCTSIGMHPNVDATPVPTEYLKPDMTVFDTVYNPAETLLLKQARQQGAITIDGLAMFVNQAAAQFKLFTGQLANLDLMRKVTTSSGLLAQYSRTIADHRSWLRSFDDRYAAKWERLLTNDPEAAICEAAVRELLGSQQVSVEPQEDLAHGGPDYRCTRDHTHFYVEVTCISRDAASEATGLRDHPWGGPTGHEMMTGKILDKVKEKATQCANRDAACLVAVCCLHSQAGGDICFDEYAAEQVLISDSYLTRDFDSQSHEPVGETYEVTDLRQSSFIRLPKTSSDPGYARRSVSAVLLCGLTARPWVMTGVLHPNPARRFDRNLLPRIKFGRLIEGSLATGEPKVEWI